MPTEVQQYTLSIKIDGTAKPELLDDLIEVVVDQAYFMPGAFTIQIQDLDLSLNSTLAIGKGVVIEFGLGDGTPTALIDGVITANEYSLSTDGAYILLVRGYDYAYKLTQGQTVRSYKESTDSDMLQKIINEAGLTPTIDSTSDIYPVFIQHGQTDWEFILAEARRLGYMVRSEAKKVYFQKPASLGSIELELGKTLLQFDPRISILGQLTETKVSGWDVVKKEVITATASSSVNSPFHALSTTGKSTIESAKGATKTYMVGQTPVINAGQATTIAQAMLNAAESQYFRAEGICYGNPDVQLGKTASITGAGTAFSKSYLITHVRHVYRQGGYLTYFSVNGAAVESLPYLLNPYESRHQMRIDGVVIAIVTNVKISDDTDKIGRVKLKYPWLDDQIESGWVRVSAPGGGNQRGMFFLPEVNDEVLVAFEYGDINCPVIIGGLYNGKDKHPLSEQAISQGGMVDERVIKTRSGHIITFSDKDGEEKISIIDKTTKNSIVLDSAANSITLKADQDITIEAGGKLILKSTSDFSMEGSKGLIKTTQGTMDVNASGALGLKTNAKATLEGTGGAEVKGATVDVVASANASVKGNAMVQIQGGIVKIN